MEAIQTIIDSHLHTWDLDRCQYSWLRGRSDVLARSHHLSEILPLMRTRGVAGAVLVQAADSADETRYLLDCAAEHAEILGVVGWLPLTSPDTVEAALDDRSGSLVGVRHLTHLEDDPGWVLMEEVVASLRLVAAAGLPFDIVGVRREELAAGVALGRRVPDLTLVLDHGGQPPAQRPGAARDPWWDLVSEFSENPRAHVKLSGLGTTTADWTTWRARDIASRVAYLIELFGPDRCMFGSDWPVCDLAGGYEHVLDITLELLQREAPEARGRILAGTALDVYGLERAARDAGAWR